ncbi:MAG TPA: CAP domain-containing protein [Solimonas sp.]|nr:CAP domain-containing protein [Solimonas sp.]
MNARTARLLLSLLLLATSAATQAQPAEYSGILQVHNAQRLSVKVPPLRWSDAAAAQAQGWAEQLAREGCVARYNPDPARREKYGENILYVTAAKPYEGWRRKPFQVANRWGEEAFEYDHATHTCKNPGGTQCGQYLQMIWETTEEMGCGRARCPAAEVWVCNYTPRGLQDGLKPYGNPLAPPTSAAEPQLVIGALECSALPQVNPGVDYPQQSPLP